MNEVLLLGAEMAIDDATAVVVVVVLTVESETVVGARGATGRLRSVETWCPAG